MLFTNNAPLTLTVRPNLEYIGTIAINTWNYPRIHHKTEAMQFLDQLENWSLFGALWKNYKC